MWQGINFSRRLFIRSVLVFLVGIGFWISIKPLVTQAAVVSKNVEDIPYFEDKSCTEIFKDFSWGNLKQDRFRCGYLVTWENYDVYPPNNTIRLKVLVALSKKTTPNPKSEPIIYLDGGPGSHGFPKGLDDALSFADFFGRDFVQFSQRGSYYSEPSLYCKEYRNLILNNWERDLKQAEWDEMIIESLGDCLKRLKDQSAFENIINFNSKFNASDVINLIDSLGYEKANLYGHSYGTLLAQHILALSPKHVSSIVLDSVMPLGKDAIADDVHNRQRVLDEIFKACNSNSSCKEAYPDLETLYKELIDQLNQTPARISVTDEYFTKNGKRSKTYSNVYLNGDGFRSAITAFLYDIDNIKKVPKVLYEASRGNFEEIGAIYLSTGRSQFFAWGMYYSVYCTEFMNFESDEFLTQVCKEYEGANNRSYGDVKIIDNQVPVLIFNGRFDPVTPPAYGKMVAEALNITDDFQFTSNKSAHGSTDNDCARSIIRDFLNKPKDAPSRDCWDKEEQGPIEFEMPGFELSDWLNQRWQDFQNWINQQWEEIKQQIEDTVNQWWQDIQDWINQQWDNFQKWLEDLLENWWQDFLNQLIQWLVELLTEILNQCLPSVLLPVGVSMGVWMSRRRQKR